MGVKAEGTISVRPITVCDRDFLLRVYSSTREEELSLVDWDQSEKTAFLQMQFSAQHSYYSQNYEGADFGVILQGEEAVGRLYVHRRPAEIRVMDITLLPEYRNKGIGGRLMQGILNEGRTAGVPVTVHVECFNPAQRFYRRLGFQKVETHGVYELMRWNPEPVATASADAAGGAG